jgi:hypothetical protein
MFIWEHRKESLIEDDAKVNNTQSFVLMATFVKDLIGAARINKRKRKKGQHG